MTPGKTVNTRTAKFPELEIDLTHCEAGRPCRAKAPGAEGYICRIHLIRRFLLDLGWLDGKQEEA